MTLIKITHTGKKNYNQNETNMTIKEYLQIEDQYFILSNKHLFIRHNKGEEFVMTPHNKKKYINPNIPEQNSTLAHHFQLPITPDHNNTLTHNNQIVYEEIYEKKTYNNAAFIGDYWPTFGLKDSYLLKVNLHPSQTKEVNELKQIEGLPAETMEQLIGRWLPLFKLSLTEYLTDTLIPTGNVVNNNDCIIPIATQVAARTIALDLVEVQPTPPLRYLNQPLHYPSDTIFTFSADTFQEQPKIGEDNNNDNS